MVKYVSIKDASLSVASGITKRKSSRGKYNVYGSTGIIGYSNLYDYSGVKILVARVGANAGTINIVNGKYGVSDNTIIIDISPQYNFKYVYYQLKYLNIHSLIFGSGQPLLTGTQLKQLQFIKLELKEQDAIAEALSNVDSLISSLQKLIEKKKDIKQGTMQELLTGKRRLPGFHGEWSRSRLGGMTEIYSGGTPSTTIPEYWGGNIPWMSSGELNNKKIYDVEGRITQEGMKNSSAHLIPQYCVLVGLAGQGKTRGTAAYNYISLCTNQSIAAIYPNDKKFDSLFLYYIIDSMYESLRELSSGDGGAED